MVPLQSWRDLHYNLAILRDPPTALLLGPRPRFTEFGLALCCCRNEISHFFRSLPSVGRPVHQTGRDHPSLVTFHREHPVRSGPSDFTILFADACRETQNASAISNTIFGPSFEPDSLFSRICRLSIMHYQSVLVVAFGPSDRKKKWTPGNE